MAKCPHCGKDVEHDSHICPECGLTLPQTDFTRISDQTLPGERPSGPEEEALPVGYVLGGRYEILQAIGKGGMGWVYKAKDREIDRIVALKTIRQELAGDETVIQRFKDEIILARKVTHKNVLRIFDIAEAEGIKFISMPYIEGTDLKSVILEQGALTVEEALRIATQVLEALSAAHEAGVIHRDLKPQNIMIDKDGTVCVADFGIAKSADAGSLTMTGQIVGTPEYMSPEQAEGKEVDFRSDLYSFGLVLYEMLTGEVPFKAESIISTLMLRLRERPRAPSTVNPNVPKWLDLLTMKALEPDLKDRYASAHEILSDIERQTVRLRRKLKPRTVFLTGVAIAAGIFAAVFLGRGSRLVVEEGGKVYLAVLPFANVTGEAELDWLTAGIPENLTADLGQSKFFRVMSSERLRQVAAEIGKDISEITTPEAMTLLAKATDLDAVVTGSFFLSGDKVRVTMNIQNPGDQELIGSAKVDADESGLLDMIDRLTTETKVIFELTQQEIDEDLDRSVGLQRTTSVKAAAEFTKGLEHSYVGAHLDAARAFEAAIDADKDFAMAYAMAGEAYRNLGYDDKAESLALIAVDKVVRFIDRVPPADRTFIMANLADITSNPEQAIDSYTEFVQTHPDDPEGYYKLALAYESVSEWDLAADNLNEALRLDPKFGSARFELGKVLIRKNDLDGALPELTSALEFYRNIANREGEAAVLNAIGVVRKRRNEFEEAISYYEASLKIKEDLGDLRGIAASLGNMGTVYQIMGEREKALEVLERSLEISRQIGDKEDISTALVKIGHIYQYSGRYEEALTYLDQSYEMRKVLGTKHLMASSLSDMGNVYTLMGDYEKALEMDRRALDLRREIGDAWAEAVTLRNMAETLMTQGLFEQASANLAEAVRIHTELEDTRQLARDNLALGGHCLARGKVDSALVYLGAALETQEALEEKPAMTATLGMMSEAYIYKAEYKRSLAAINQAVTLAKDVSEKESIVDVLLVKARFFNELGYGPGCDSVMAELRSYDEEALSFETKCRLKMAEARQSRARGRSAEALAQVAALSEGALSRSPRCEVESILISGGVLASEERLDEAEEALSKALERARQHSLRDLEAQALWRLGSVIAGQGRSEEGLELCREAMGVMTRRGLSDYECLAAAGRIALSADAVSEAADYLARALDQAAIIYGEKCPPRLLHSYLAAKHVPEYVDHLEDLLMAAGRNEEAREYRAKFPLK